MSTGQIHCTTSNLSLCPLTCSFLRPSHWWRSTPSSKMMSLYLMPSGWLRMITLRKHKKVSLPHQQDSHFTFNLQMRFFRSACWHPSISANSEHSHSQCLHIEVIKRDWCWVQTFFSAFSAFSAVLDILYIHCKT